MKETNDPRFSNDDDRWDKFPYFGELKKAPGEIIWRRGLFVA